MRSVRWALAVAILAGSLVLSSTGVARAATEFSESDGWALDWGYTGVGGIACAGAVRWKVVDGTAVTLIGQAKCRTTGAITGLGGFDSGSTTTVRFGGPRVGIGGGAPGPGGPCLFSTGPMEFSGDPAVATISVTGELGCMIDTVCQSVDMVRDTMADDQFREECTSISLGEAPTEENEPGPCPAGQLTGGFKSQYHLTGDPVGNDRIQANFVGEFPGDGATTKGRWFWYVALKDPVTLNVTYPNFTYGTATGSGAQSDLAPVFSPHWGRIAQYATHSDGSVVKWTHVTGVGAVWVSSTSTTAPSGWNSLYTDASPSGLMGRNEPANCRFYIGSKIASNSSTTFDEPGGILGDGGIPDPDTTAPDPEDDTENGCNFSFTDPTTWAGGGICELVSLIRDLISAVVGIPSAILGGLGAVFELLFVPDEVPSFSDVQLDVPEGWIPSMPALSDGTCGTLTLPSVDLGTIGGASAATELLDTCAAPWPTVRSFTYNGLLALVLVGLIRAVFRMLMKSVGMGVEQGGGDDD